MESSESNGINDVKWPREQSRAGRLASQMHHGVADGDRDKRPAEPLGRAHHAAAVPRETIDSVHALQSAFGRLPDEEVCRVDKVRESLVGAAIDFPIQDQVTPL